MATKAPSPEPSAELKTALTTGAAATPPTTAPKEKTDSIGDWLMQHKKDFELVLPRHLSIDKMLRLAAATFRKNPALMACTLPSVAGSLMEATALGLEVNTPLGLAFLVPFNNAKLGTKECQLIVGYKGLIELFYRSRSGETLFGAVVYEADAFDYEYGTAEFLHHKPARVTADKKGKIVCAYAYAKLIGAGYRFIVLSKEEIDRIRDEFSAGYAQNPEASPWSQHYEDMAVKTAVRALAPFIPKSAEFARAISNETRVITPADFVEIPEPLKEGEK